MKLILFMSLFLISSTYASFDDDYVSMVMKYASKTNEKLYESERFISKFNPYTFNCQIGPLTNPRPTSVHSLRPSDIEVIGAIGDSLTAANGAKASTILGLLEECRGVSWNMGGENADITKSVTLPNILRKFNPNLHGFSTGSGKNTSSNAVFNSANPGDTSFEMYEQAISVVKNIKNSNKVDFQNSWKLITFFVGGNDLCKSCKNSKYTIQNYVDNVRKTLDYFRDNLPRTLVNLVLTLDVRGIELLTGITCRNMQKTFCSCVFEDSFKATLQGLTKGFQRGVEDLISSGRYDTKDDFTVVVQPFMTKMSPPLTSTGAADYSYFAPDCFHFSTKGHQAAAIELWNSLLTPVGQKTTSWNLNTPIQCPTQLKPYIYTNKNSRSGYILNTLIKN